MGLDLETFRADATVPIVEAVKPRRKGGGQTYLGGKPPMWWLQRAAAKGKAALMAGLALWFKYGVQKNQKASIRVDASLRRSMGLSHDQTRRGVHALDAAGLVTIEQGGRGRCAVVTLVAEFTEPSVPAAESPRAARETEFPGFGAELKRTMATGPRSAGTGGKESDA
jgi:hypothetical protein